VFDTPAGRSPGAFTFRFWINDTTPPTISLRTRKVSLGKPIRLTLHDAGAGVDPRSIYVALGGRQLSFSYKRGTLTIPTVGAHTGRLRLTVEAADYQELKNMEDVGPVLPNTRVFRAFVTIR
jgi:hypothetical protein